MLSTEILIFKHGLNKRALQKKLLIVPSHKGCIILFVLEIDFYFYISFNNVQKPLEIFFKYPDIFIYFFTCRSKIKFLFP